MSAVDEIEDPVIRSNKEDWKGYLALVHSKPELDMDKLNDYSEELSDIEGFEDLDNILGEDLERSKESSQQLAYDFGYSIAEAHKENNEKMLKLFPDSTFLRWFEKFTANGHKPPNLQYAVRGMTDFMAQTSGYENIL